MRAVLVNTVPPVCGDRSGRGGAQRPPRRLGRREPFVDPPLGQGHAVPQPLLLRQARPLAAGDSPIDWSINRVANVLCLPTLLPRGVLLAAADAFSFGLDEAVEPPNTTLLRNFVQCLRVVLAPDVFHEHVSPETRMCCRWRLRCVSQARLGLQVPADWLLGAGRWKGWRAVCCIASVEDEISCLSR
jgi:hypothetical protein